MPPNHKICPPEQLFQVVRFQDGDKRLRGKKYALERILEIVNDIRVAGISGSKVPEDQSVEVRYFALRIELTLQDFLLDFMFS